MQNIEFEGKILGISIDKTIKQIKKVGGKLVQKQAFKRYVFNVIPAKKGTWVRLRTDGTTTTLTVKEIKHEGIDGTYEYETVVQDFENTLVILKKMGLTPHGYEENRRTEFKVNDVFVSIDEWPLIPPYLEIEGPNKSSVLETVQLLGYDSSQLTGKNTKKVYADYGIDLDKIESLRFK